MWTSYVCVVVILPLLAAAESNIFYEYTNGWIPVSSETVYEQIKRQNDQIPTYIASQNIQVLHTDINNLSYKNTDKTTDTSRPQKTAAIRKEDSKNNEYDCDIEDGDCEHIIIDEPTKTTHYRVDPNNDNENNTEYQPARRSKKIADFNANKYLQDLFLPDKPPINIKDRTYEVTEDVLELDEINTSNEGYKYEPPEKKNHTDALYEILAKYKINKDDVLPNYLLSRKHKVQNPLKQSLSTKSIQNPILYKYNNLNHLPIDPVIAVFLSNYGFYLQGMYGRNNKYNNLYGYLASNNIHNNMPFGLYKTFSDTDSSH